MDFLWILVGYVVGSTPFGYIAGRMKGIDIREHGSKNIGSTNVLRVLGKGIGYPVFALDVLKGVVPVLLARIYAQDVEPVGLVPALTSIATILGHNYTFWLGFKGGKGIATSAGALLPIMPFTILAAVTLWVVTFLTTRYVSLGSIVAALTLPTSFLIQGVSTGAWNWPLLGLASLIGGLAVFKHRANIERLRRGTENKFERKKKTVDPA
ncbi:MAG: glycerol-3-phosphate acyltransferase PlsY [Verrucomicrobia bacterium]|jgi:glycerol-3-phosphate acyltransferase PlsY|nr:MAG: glycerol-3-phosphate acyltransferase PlsY [Verrucomicrobiota bacterium]